MKKLIFLITFLILNLSLCFSAISTARPSKILIDGTTTYTMTQNKDSWIAARFAEYPTGTTIISYKVDYTTTSATTFMVVWTSTNTWETASQIANK
jgi:hypothetical protein